MSFHDMSVNDCLDTVCRTSATISSTPSSRPPLSRPPRTPSSVRAYVSVDGVTVFPIKLNCGQINEA